MLASDLSALYLLLTLASRDASRHAAWDGIDFAGHTCEQQRASLACLDIDQIDGLQVDRRVVVRYSGPVSPSHHPYRSASDMLSLVAMVRMLRRVSVQANSWWPVPPT